jgi:hypothetical protein
MWTYKTGYFNSSEKELDNKLNEWGKEGWEIFSLVEYSKTNEMTSKGDLVIKFRIMMKKQVDAEKGQTTVNLTHTVAGYTAEE